MKKKRAHVVLSALALSLAVTGFTPATTEIPNPFAITAEAAAKVKLNKSKATLAADQGILLELKGYSGTVKWSSSNKKVATVNKNGLVKAKKKGSTVITAKAGKKKYKCRITVKALKVKSLKLNEKTLTLKKGSKATLKATASPANASNKGVTWKSSNTKVATVSSKGVVTAKKNGTATITATTKDGSKKRATCKVTVAKAGSSEKNEYKSLSELYEEEEKRLNIPVNDVGTTWGFDKGNSNIHPLKVEIGKTTVVEYLGQIGNRGIHSYSWRVEDPLGTVIDPLTNGYVEVRKEGNYFYIKPLRDGYFKIQIVEDSIPESSGYSRNQTCNFQTENFGKGSAYPSIGGKYYRKYHHLDSPIYTVKAYYQNKADVFECEESTTGNIVIMQAHELEPVSMWE